MSRLLSKHRTVSILAVLAVLLFFSITLGVSVGTARLSFQRVWGIIFHQMFPEWQWLGTEFPRNEVGIVWLIRFPRVLLGAIVGAGLATAGTVIQSLVRNSLADPYLLGISSGACAGAVFAMLFLPRFFGIVLTGMFGVSASAFIGAGLAFMLAFVIARQSGALTPVRMVLSGLAVSYVFMAATNFMVYMEQRNGAESAMFWMLGGLGGARWNRLLLPFAVLIASLIVFIAQSRPLNALLLGDENASALGVDVTKFRRFLLIITSILTGVIVTVSGSIGFVGLIVPHAMRMLVGSDHRRLLPVGALAGANFLIWADLFARTALAPRELPLGIITGFVGAPFFVWLLRRSGRDSR
jgi:iron complex transport system permease protein